MAPQRAAQHALHLTRAGHEPLEEMGYETRIDLERLVACAREVQGVLGRPLGSHVLTAGPVDWHRA